ncbi:hypothetical protein EV715DRAFT_286092 [Schizophyllum commune]
MPSNNDQNPSEAPPPPPPPPPTASQASQTCPCSSSEYKGHDVDYEEKYAPDPYGEELNSRARVWSVYIDESKKADREETTRLDGTLDVLLVYAGLFSAVVTTFVSQSSSKLEPDYAKITASLVYELVLMQRTAGSGTPRTEVPTSQFTDDSDTTTTSDLWVNGLWMASLSLSLLTALLSVLAKQWIQYFNSMHGRTPRQRAFIRQYRHQSFERWKVSLIVSSLPILLNVALLLFLAGLAVFTTAGNHSVSIVVICFSTFITLVFIVSVLLPVFVHECAYKTAIFDCIMHMKPSGGHEQADRRDDRHPMPHFRRWEASEVKRQSTIMMHNALDWLCSSSSNTSAVTIATQGVISLFARTEAPHEAPLNIQTDFMRDAGVRLFPSLKQLSSDLSSLVKSVLGGDPSDQTIAARVMAARQGDRLAKQIWMSPGQKSTWAKHSRDLENLEDGLRDVILISKHLRDRARVGARGFPSSRFTDIGEAIDNTQCWLPNLLLHPLVWRDLELAVSYALSLDELNRLQFPLPDSAMSKDDRRLTLHIQGNPLECTPISLHQYAKARGWKGGGEMLANNLKELSMVLEKSPHPGGNSWAILDSNKIDNMSIYSEHEEVEHINSVLDFFEQILEEVGDVFRDLLPYPGRQRRRVASGGGGTEDVAAQTEGSVGRDIEHGAGRNGGQGEPGAA